jgi:MSHA biogenesis protein MshG
MGVYTYKARSRSGELLTGQLDAATPGAAASQLADAGITPVDISEGRPDVGLWSHLLARLGAHQPNLTDLFLLCRQLYTLLKAGVPINRALVSLGQSLRNAVLSETLRDVLTSLESGRDLAGSLGKHPRVFSNLFVSIVRVGEESGRLDEALLRLSRYLEFDKETRARIKATMRYPLMVILAIGFAIGIVNVMVIPTFAQLFAKVGAELPWQTRVLVAVSDFFVAWWHLLLAGMVAGFLGLRHYLRTEVGRYRWDKLKLRLPIVGDIIRRATLGRFARAFSMALMSGVPLLQALTVVARAVDNTFVGEQILAMRTGIERGDTLSRTAAGSGLFTPLVLQMLAVGEESGSIDDLLGEVADYYEREVQYDVQNLGTAMEPVLIVAIGGLVLMLALGVFLPMWELSTAFKH